MITTALHTDRCKTVADPSFTQPLQILFIHPETYIHFEVVPKLRTRPDKHQACAKDVGAIVAAMS